MTTKNKSEAEVDKQNDNTPKNLKDLFIQILVLLLIGGGIVAVFGGGLKQRLIRYWVTYNLTIEIKNADRASFDTLKMIINSDDDSQPRVKNIGTQGKAIFRLKAGAIYNYHFFYQNRRVSEDFSAWKDTLVVVDMANLIVNPKTGLKVEANLPQPSKSKIERPVKISIDKVEIQQKPAEVLVPSNTHSENGITPVMLPLTADDIIKGLELHVKIDSTDSYKNRGKQFAYHYYLKGDQSLLNRIVQVFYKRNDPTFPEYIADEFYPIDQRSTGFEYVGYQWGSVFTTYVQVQLEDQTKSKVFLKTIVYDK